MINYSLPVKLTIDDEDFPINKNGDFRVILDVICALNDTALEEEERIFSALCIFFDFNIPQNIYEAYKQMALFISCGEENCKTAPSKPLMDWEKDFNLIIPAVNKSLGYEVRSAEYLHWWTFMSGYMEIGKDCSFTYITALRSKINKNIPLDKWEKRYLEENKDLVLLPAKYTKEEEEFLNTLIGGE